MRKSLCTLLLATTTFGACSKKSMDMEATRSVDQPQLAPMADKKAMDDGVASGEAKPADSRAGASMGMGSSSAPMPEPAKDMARTPSTVAPGGAMPQAVADVRAGEWDDNANYRDYVKWLKETPRGIARLDISDRQFLVVKDKDGKPVPNCKVTVTGGQGSTTLITMASGRALLFPHDSGLDGQKLTATAACTQAKVTAEIERKLDGVSELVLSSARALPARRTIDLAFVLDTTGSMSEEIGAVKATIRAVATKLSNDQTDVRIGLVEYKDHGDENVTRTFPFSSDLAAFGKSVDGLSANGGGDYPEDMQAGLGAALDKLQWRDNAVARLVVVIADAPPHLDYQNEKDYADAARRASSRGIKLYTVSASGMDATGQIVMRQMAQFTGASNLFVLRGGAGPQSVGGGDPKSSCGGTQEQYTSGKLDQLIINKVRQELASIDADPTRIAGIGKDESSKPCNQRIVMAY